MWHLHGDMEKKIIVVIEVAHSFFQAGTGAPASLIQFVNFIITWMLCLCCRNVLVNLNSETYEFSKLFNVQDIRKKQKFSFPKIRIYP